MRRYQAYLRFKIDGAHATLAEVLEHIERLGGEITHQEDKGSRDFARPPRRWPELRKSYDYDVFFAMDPAIQNFKLQERLKFVPNLVYKMTTLDKRTKKSRR